MGRGGSSEKLRIVSRKIERNIIRTARAEDGEFLIGLRFRKNLLIETC